MPEDQLELLTPRLYEDLAIALRAFVHVIVEPTDAHASAHGKAVRAYRTAWIKHARHRGAEADEHVDRIIARLVRVATEAVDGSLIAPESISPELRETLERLRSRAGDDPELGKGEGGGA